MDVSTITGVVGAAVAALGLYRSWRNSKKDVGAIWKSYAKAVIRSHAAPLSRFRYGHVDDAIVLECGTSSDTRSHGLLDLLLKRTTSPSLHRKPLLVLGEYGQGKSIASGALASTLATRMQTQKPPTPIPVLIPLRDGPTLADIDAAAVQAIRSLYNQVIPPDVLASANMAGQLVFILDGFDEYLERSPETDTAAVIFEILQHPAFRDNALVLTCRPNAFDPEFLSTLQKDFEIIRLHFPRILQVVEYLKVHGQLKLLSIAQKPGNEHFADLIKRPLFLDMAVASADLLASDESLNQNTIYLRYFETWYERERQKLGTEIKRLRFEQVDEILSQAAWLMFQQHTSVVPEQEFVSIVQAVAGLNISQGLDQLRRQATRRLLLVPEDRGKARYLTFRHESLKAYFLARHLYRQFLGDTQGFALPEALESMTLSFFVTIMSGSKDGAEAIRTLYAAKCNQPVARGDRMLAAIILWVIRCDPRLIDTRQLQEFCSKADPLVRTLLVSNLASVDLSRIDLSGIDLSAAVLRNSILREVKLVATNLTEARLEGADLTGALFRETKLDRATLKYAKLDGTTLQGLSVVNATIQEVSAQRSTLVSSQFIQCNFAKANCESASFEDCTFSDCYFAGSLLNNLARCSRVHWKGCELSGASFHGTTLSECSFDGSSTHEAVGLKVA